MVNCLKIFGFNREVFEGVCLKIVKNLDVLKVFYKALYPTNIVFKTKMENF